VNPRKFSSFSEPVFWSPLTFSSKRIDPPRLSPLRRKWRQNNWLQDTVLWFWNELFHEILFRKSRLHWSLFSDLIDLRCFGGSSGNFLRPINYRQILLTIERRRHWQPWAIFWTRRWPGT
jgi:hypothetical protein